MGNDPKKTILNAQCPMPTPFGPEDYLSFFFPSAPLPLCPSAAFYRYSFSQKGVIHYCGNKLALKTTVKPIKITVSAQVTRFRVVSALLVLLNNCAWPPIAPIPSPLGLCSSTRIIRPKADKDQITSTTLTMVISILDFRF